MGNCHPEKTNVDRGEASDSVDIGFLGVTISHVTLSCIQYLYNIELYNPFSWTREPSTLISNSFPQIN